MGQCLHHLHDPVRKKEKTNCFFSTKFHKVVLMLEFMLWIPRILKNVFRKFTFLRLVVLISNVRVRILILTFVFLIMRIQISSTSLHMYCMFQVYKSTILFFSFSINGVPYICTPYFTYMLYNHTQTGETKHCLQCTCSITSCMHTW